MAVAVSIKVRVTSVKPGDRFTQWTAIERTTDGPNGGRRWMCRCACGTERPVYESMLLSKKESSCGCLTAIRIERAFELGREAGYTGLRAVPSMYRNEQLREAWLAGHCEGARARKERDRKVL